MKKPLINFPAIIIPIVSTVASIIKDKKQQQQYNNSTTSTENPSEKGISISSKRLLNVVGSGAIITVALSDIAVHGITVNNLVLTGIGVVYCLGMSHLVAASEAS